MPLLSEKMRKVYEDKAMSSQKPSQTPPPGGSGGTAPSPTPAPPATAPSTAPPTPPEPVVPDESPDAEYGTMHGKPRPSEAELAAERERVRREAEEAGQVRPPKQPPLSDTGAKPAR